MITIRLRYGGKLHAVTTGAESPRVTLCKLAADGAAIVADVPTCIRCLREIARRA